MHSGTSSFSLPIFKQPKICSDIGADGLKRGFRVDKRDGMLLSFWIIVTTSGFCSLIWQVRIFIEAYATSATECYWAFEHAQPRQTFVFQLSKCEERKVCRNKLTKLCSAFVHAEQCPNFCSLIEQCEDLSKRMFQCDKPRNSFFGLTNAKLLMRITKVFAIAGLDGRAISSKSLLGFSSGLTLIIKRQNVIFNF